jgi:hypothetical protein
MKLTEREPEGGGATPPEDSKPQQASSGRCRERRTAARRRRPRHRREKSSGLRLSFDVRLLPVLGHYKRSSEIMEPTLIAKA